MKKLSLILMVLVLATTSKALATDARIAEMGEKSLEAEIENLEIGELEGQREQSLTEAKHQESRAKEIARELASTRERKKGVEKRAKKAISNSEYRRTKAEKEQRHDNKETNYLEKQIVKLQKESERAETAARKSEDRAERAKQILEKAKGKKLQTQARKQAAIDNRIQKERETIATLAERKKTLIEAAQIEKDSRLLEKKLAVTTHIAESAVNALDLAKEKRAHAMAKRDQGVVALASAQADIKSLEKEYKKILADTKRAQEIAQQNEIELQKRQAYASHHRQEISLAKSRNKTARASLDRRPASN